VETIAANTLVLRDYEETFSLPIVEALYCILDDGRLSLSIQTEPHPLMQEAVFTFERFTLMEDLVAGALLSIPDPQGERDDFDTASTHLYFGAHDDPRDTILNVISFSSDTLEVVGTFRWHELYHPDSGQMRYAEASLHARCRRVAPSALRVLM
jgi:hypothetical protein